MAQVIFCLNGGSNGPSNISSGVPINNQAIPTTIPTRSGYTFSHWYDKDGNIYEPYTTLLNVDTNETLVLYAYWIKN